jgi:polar amino acid transport system substrate-binding protein
MTNFASPALAVARYLPTLALAAAFSGTLAADPTGPTPLVRAALAPSGVLRVGVYPGTPTSYLPPQAGVQARGVGYELAHRLAQDSGLAFEPVVFANNAEVLAALDAGTIDLAFTNATPERAGNMEFGPICLDIELGYLVRAGSPVATIMDADRPGIRLGVTAQSSTDSKFTREFKSATLVRAETVIQGASMLAAGQIDAYATNKPTLFEMSEHVPGSRVLDGRWGFEHLALAVPKGHYDALPYLRIFTERAQSRGWVRDAAERAGLRGAVWEIEAASAAH